LARLWNASPSLPAQGPVRFGANGNSAPVPLPQVSLDPWQGPIYGPFAATRSRNVAATETNQSPRTSDLPASRLAPTAVVATDPPRSIPADFLLSIPRGILSGLAHTASASGQAAQIEMQQPVDVPSGDEGLEITEQNVTGPLPRPQGIGGQFGATIGSFIGTPLTYISPGGLGSKLLMAITAGFGSEAAGQLTKGTSAEPFARISGAVLGAGLGGAAMARGTAAAESAANAARGSGGQLARPVHSSISPITPLKPEIGYFDEVPSIVPGTDRVPGRNEPSVSRADLDEFRARIRVPTKHTVAVARTNVPGLENIKLEGASPLVWDEAELPRPPPGPIMAPSDNPLKSAHAEQDIANKFVREVEERGLKPSDLDGYQLSIHVSHPKGVCPTCRAGLDSDKAPGVLRQLSERYPGLSIHVTVDTQPGIMPMGPTAFVIKNGRYIHRSDR